jgi:hypothetical protein
MNLSQFTVLYSQGVLIAVDRDSLESLKWLTVYA